MKRVKRIPTNALYAIVIAAIVSEYSVITTRIIETQTLNSIQGLAVV